MNIPTGIAWLDTLLVAAATVAALAVLFKPVRGAVRFLHNIATFLEDWFGEPGRPGVPARCGVMERLGRVEDRTMELVTNGGSSMKDALTRVDNRMDAFDSRLLILETKNSDRIIEMREARE